MQKKGFTIIELLIVVIIIGVLATIAVPQFTKAVEKARMGKAKNELGLIYKAMQMARAENTTNIYTNDMATLDGYVELGVTMSGASATDKQGEWTYVITTGGSGTQFTIAASRQGSGAMGGKYFTMNETQSLDYANLPTWAQK